jgi:uncharacterized protein YijF (DUF1287 family)
MKHLKPLFIASFITILVALSLSTWRGQADTVTETRPADAWSTALIDAARNQIGVTVIYDGSYQGLDFPMGDINRMRGVCSDVVIRAFRDAHGLDLQVLVNRDMKAAFSSYPAKWGLRRTDRNIDHRRVPNLRRYFERHNAEVPVDDTPDSYLPGDLVTWMLRPGTPHIGIIGNSISTRTGNPLVIHNIGLGAHETDMLFRYEITGHYRPVQGRFQ